MSRLGEPGIAEHANLGADAPLWGAPNIWPDRPDEPPRHLAGVLRRDGGTGHRPDAVVRTRPRARRTPLRRRPSTGTSTNLTANHYPPVTDAPLPDQYRKGPHSDWGSLTILYQDGTGGLEVARPADAAAGWTCRSIAGTYVVNIGDLMATWTNDVWRSTKHRVRVPPPERRGAARVSIPFFHHPNWDAVIDCLPDVRVGRTPGGLPRSRRAPTSTPRSTPRSPDVGLAYGDAIEMLGAEAARPEIEVST